MTLIPRSNHAMATLVDQGILIAEQFGNDKGSRFMRRHNVPFEVALRVLSRPSERRNGQ
ncbi:hypothetical protein [Parasulfuritortus cantonensis]|uniref:hypothetical protein n=1 Tax=Parasulfuritortus cantonensis TaxID=2528202 RepID=UPI0014048B0B|nr:hypothetical protein [Parasulfuritortus cantonensis]